MRERLWCLALGIFLMQALSVNAQVTKGVMAVRGAEMN